MPSRRKSPPRRELAALRLQAGFSQASFANAVGASLNTVRSWEQGWSGPMPRYRQPIARVLGVSLPEVDRLIDGRTPDTRSHPVPEWLTHYESLVQGAGRLSEIMFGLVPALLQTRAYFTALLERDWLRLDEGQVTERADQRMSWQDVLHRPEDPLHLVALIPELVLSEVVGGSGVMYEQLDHLVTMAQQPNVEVRIVPADGRANGAVGGFQLLTRPDGVMPFMACTADVGGVRYHEDVDVVAKFADRFAHLATVSLPPGESIAHIQTLQRNHR